MWKRVASFGSLAGKALLLGLTVVALACCPKPPPPDPKPALYEGPLVSTQEVVLRVSQQSSAIRTLWARHDFSMKLVDSKGVHNVDGDGILQLRKPAQGEGAPAELRLQGSKDVFGEIFDAGANSERAWLIVRHDVDTMWWFEQANGDRIDAATLPARPDQLADALGLADLSTDLTAYPAPVMRYDGETDCYVLLFVEPAPGPDRLVTRREMWVDRKDFRPRRVVLFSSDGRVAAQSELSAWQPVLAASSGGAAATSRPVVGWAPRDITLSFPQNRSTMRFTLRDVQDKSDRGFPKDASFAFPREPGVGTLRELGK